MSRYAALHALQLTECLGEISGTGMAIHQIAAIEQHHLTSPDRTHHTRHGLVERRLDFFFGTWQWNDQLAASRGRPSNYLCWFGTRGLRRFGDATSWVCGDGCLCLFGIWTRQRIGDSGGFWPRLNRASAI